MIDMTLGIVGGGVVGGATARAFVEHVKGVRVYDLQPTRRTHTVDDVLDCDVVMICLPTPQKKNSLECDTSYVEDFLNGIAGSDRFSDKNIVIRSTVPVGFTRRMRTLYELPNLCHSPEFLTARCADLNAQMPNRSIVGVPDYYERQEFDHDTCPIGKLYQLRWPHLPITWTDSNSSEAAKLMLNSFFAVKVGLFNEFKVFADQAGADWEEILDIIHSDGRLHPSHTNVPGPDGKYGFGGTCLRKDLASLVYQMDAAGLHKVLDGELAQKHGYGSIVEFITEAAYWRNRLDRERQR